MVGDRAKQEATVLGAIFDCPAQKRATDCIIQSSITKQINGEGDFSISSSYKIVIQKDLHELHDLCNSCKSCYLKILQENGWFKQKL